MQDGEEMHLKKAEGDAEEALTRCVAPLSKGVLLLLLLLGSLFQTVLSFHQFFASSSTGCSAC